MKIIESYLIAFPDVSDLGKVHLTVRGYFLEYWSVVDNKVTISPISAHTAKAYIDAMPSN